MPKLPEVTELKCPGISELEETPLPSNLERPGELLPLPPDASPPPGHITTLLGAVPGIYWVEQNFILYIAKEIRHSSKCFINVSSFNSHNNPVNPCYFHPRFTDEETEAQGGCRAGE